MIWTMSETPRKLCGKDVDGNPLFLFLDEFNGAGITLSFTNSVAQSHQDGIVAYSTTLRSSPFRNYEVRSVSSTICGIPVRLFNYD